MSMFPLVEFDRIALDKANDCLARWGHKMGPLNRGVQGDRAYGLHFGPDLVAVAIHSTLIRENVAGLPDHTRARTIELSRLCAARPGLCRVALRLWREAVFPTLGYSWAISYQDADLHSGNTYRFDGWARMGYSHSGTDNRSGRKGRNKWIWRWPAMGAI